MSPEAAGARLDAFVASTLGVSRAVAAALVDGCDVMVDGHRALARSVKVRAGQTVELPPAPEPFALVPEPGPLNIAYEDEEVVVVDKPAGLVVHPGSGVTTGTLAGRLLAAYPELAGVGEPERPGILHRLDRDTSGLLAVARTPDALARLQDGLRRREVTREYLALVLGKPEPARGTVDAPVGADLARRGRRRVAGDGRPARTHFEVRRSFTSPPTSLLEVRLETGRTHQIRVHLAAIGHPVAGDGVYGGRQAAGAVPGLSRPFLHAFRLGLPGRPPIESALPAELQTVLSSLIGGPPLTGGAPT